MIGENMEKTKEFKQMSIGERARGLEKLGAKVAKIMNKAREQCNKLLEPLGYGVNFKAEFYRTDTDEIPPEITEKLNG